MTSDAPAFDREPSRMEEDYLTNVWKAYEWPGDRPTTTDLAARLGVTPSTVSANLKKLARDALIEYEPYGSIQLTDAGRAIATRVVRRHRIIETYLVQRLGLGWDEVHDEADRLEHAVSDLVLDAMDAELGHPAADPHGDPIPGRDGSIPFADAPTLAAVGSGVRVRVVRVADRHPEVLRYLSEKGVAVGTELVVVTAMDASGAMRVRHAGGAAGSGGAATGPAGAGSANAGGELELSATAADSIRALPL
ncbi:metal-dependent transcriptional regulator [Schumannella sp. 10F1B-5-1]|uniref:metal-dependent transcriptional regulator n=1 Tax=Schumannella sp. 10F1B-5-1 TaxID=2590780 RepID=UPI001130AB55|nr:metal-dependent transcriptional regulator [Schumannella sp. 10F1B-5-1]TPW76693.1 metal-dependent transcriptional regulator [Schumannella sp. 10F1B-5-1]